MFVPSLRALRPRGPAPGCPSGAANATSSHSFCMCRPLCPDVSLLPSPPHLCSNVTSSKRISLIITPLSLSNTNTLLYFSSEHHLSPDVWLECKHLSIQTVCHMARSGMQTLFAKWRNVWIKDGDVSVKAVTNILRVIGSRCFLFPLCSFLYCFSNRIFKRYFPHWQIRGFGLCLLKSVVDLEEEL